MRKGRFNDYVSSILFNTDSEGTTGTGLAVVVREIFKEFPSVWTGITKNIVITGGTPDRKTLGTSIHTYLLLGP